MTRIALLTCSNTTQDMGCSSFMCLEGMRSMSGQFARYKDKGGAELAGIISCAGCPTTIAPEKLLGRVRSLTSLGVEAVHLSSCMMSICPFKNKYLDLLRTEFPDVKFVQGTHGTPETEQQFRQMA
ncbi:MAG TPA: CGGC domain-containing protein, partial [Methanocellaceae archaeon]